MMTVATTGNMANNKLHLNNLYFISIEDLPAADEFSTWLSERSRHFDNSLEFREWLAAYRAFPLSLYIGGTIFTFFSRDEAALWVSGFDTALSLLKENEWH